MGAPSVPVHPTEIYEAVLDLGLYAALAWVYRRKKFDGQIFGLYLVGYAVLRWLVEMFRGDYPQYQYLWGWLTPGQVASAIILAGGLVLLGMLPRRALTSRRGEVRRKEGT
jgi:phosphatidylglycerol:prolipoprotein diacylglycerol transferase